MWQFKLKTLVSGLILCSLLGACATHPSNPQDPYEPFNRAVFSFNQTADKAVLIPVAKGYKQITPSPVQSGVNNFFGNIQDAYSMLANLLRWEPQKAMNDLMRFSMNTVFGGFGLMDFATPAGLTKNRTSFGDTLATWGWKNSHYLVLPILGPSTVRDTTGRAAGFITSGPENWVYHNTREAIAYYGLDGISTRAEFLDATKAIDEAALDPYSFTRDAYLQLRAKQLNQAPDEHDIDTGEEELNIDDLVAPDPPLSGSDLTDQMPSTP